MVIIADHETFFRINGIHWYLFLWSCWISLGRLPESRSGKGLLAGVIFFTVWSSPSSVILLPIMALRFLSEPIKGIRLFWGFAILNYLAMLLTITPDAGANYTFADKALGFVNALSFRVVGDTVLGHGVAMQTVLGSMLPYYGLTIMALGVIAMHYLKSLRSGDRILLLASVYLIMAGVYTLTARPWLANFVHVDADKKVWTWLFHGRYFFCPFVSHFLSGIRQSGSLCKTTRARLWFSLCCPGVSA